MNANAQNKLRTRVRGEDWGSHRRYIVWRRRQQPYKGWSWMAGGPPGITKVNESRVNAGWTVPSGIQQKIDAANVQPPLQPKPKPKPKTRVRGEEE